MSRAELARAFGAMRHEVIIQAVPCEKDREGIADLDLSTPSGQYGFLSYHCAQRRH